MLHVVISSSEETNTFFSENLFKHISWFKKQVWSSKKNSEYFKTLTLLYRSLKNNHITKKL